MSTILVVEDTMTQAEIITGSLKNAGFNTILAMNGDEARTKISQQKPSAIVLDVVLPNESGVLSTATRPVVSAAEIIKGTIRITTV